MILGASDVPVSGCGEGDCSPFPCRFFRSSNAGIHLLVRFLRLGYFYASCNTLAPKALPREGSMKYEPNNITSRIQWCRLQQRLPSITQEERVGWQMEEAGLIDALGNRDRTAFMREKYRSQFARYQCGFEDGKALLRVSTVFASGMTPMEGLGPARSTTPARVDRHPSHAPPPVHEESRR